MRTAATIGVAQPLEHKVRKGHLVGGALCASEPLYALHGLLRRVRAARTARWARAVMGSAARADADGPTARFRRDTVDVDGPHEGADLPSPEEARGHGREGAQARAPGERHGRRPVAKSLILVVTAHLEARVLARGRTRGVDDARHQQQLT